MEPYIVLDGVSKSFRSAEVLKPLSIEFEQGLIHGIVGRNGSGKTVMMKLILGFLKPTQGTVTVGKKRVGKDVDFPQDVVSGVGQRNRAVAGFRFWRASAPFVLLVTEL